MHAAVQSSVKMYSAILVRLQELQNAITQHNTAPFICRVRLNTYVKTTGSSYLMDKLLIHRGALR